MKRRSLRMGYRIGTTAALAAALIFVAASGRAQRGDGGPFAGLAGNWSGSGTITVSNGTSERIRCRAKYAVSDGGTGLQQDLRCASDSYKFEVNSNVNTTGGGGIAGSWTELTRNASGNVLGNASSGRIDATVAGVGFSAGLSVTTSGNSQSVTIKPVGTDVTLVSITMRRG